MSFTRLLYFLQYCTSTAQPLKFFKSTCSFSKNCFEIHPSYFPLPCRISKGRFLFWFVILFSWLPPTCVEAFEDCSFRVEYVVLVLLKKQSFEVCKRRILPRLLWVHPAMLLIHYLRLLLDSLYSIWLVWDHCFFILRLLHFSSVMGLATVQSEHSPQWAVCVTPIAILFHVSAFPDSSLKIQKTCLVF